MSYNLGALFPGMEVISFQNESQLGKDLEAVFQKVLDYKETIDYSRCGPSDEEKRMYKIDQVHKFVAENTAKEFMAVLKKDVGFGCKKVYVSGGDQTGISDDMAICLDISNMLNGYYINMSKATGNPLNITETDKVKEASERFAELADCIDLEKSHLKKTKLKDGTPIYVTAVYMAANTLFLMEEFVPESVTKPLTAREMAAIYLHEIGHAMTVIEHSADLFATFERMKSFVGNKKNNFKTIKEADDYVNFLDKKVMPNLKATVKKLTDDGILIGYMAAYILLPLNLLFSILDGLRNITRGSSTLVNIPYNTLALILPVFSVVTNLLTAIITAISIMLSNARLLAFVDTYYNDDHGSKKSSDRKNTRNNSFLIERWADEFATRHGYGKDLVFALDKITAAFKYTSVVWGRDAFLAHSGLIGNVMSIFVWISSKYYDFVGKLCKTPRYEDDFYRARRILQNMKQRFKEEKLPNTQCDELLKQLDETEQKLSSLKNVENTSVMEVLGNIIDNTIDPLTWIEMLKDGKMNRDFAILQNKLDDISSNKLYSLSYKLMNLGV